jgi:hypothetical protein
VQAPISSQLVVAKEQERKKPVTVSHEVHPYR